MGSDFNIDQMKTKPLNEILTIIKGMCELQSAKADVAIPCLVGDAGIGKTASLQKMCHDNDYNLIDIHYGLKPLEDISGLPDFAETVTINGIEIKNTRWTLPDILGEVWNLSQNGKLTVIFLDDFHAASPGNMALGYEMFTERKLRGYPFPDRSAFVLAANCQGSKDLANTIPAPIVNRIAMFPVHVEFSAWKKNFAIPYGVNSKVLSFLSNTKNRKYFQQEEQVNKPWASARAWTKLSGLINPLEDAMKTIKHQDILYFAEAHVGEEAAAEFTTYYKIFSEVETDKIFNGEIEPEVPHDMSGQYVFILANVSEFFNRFLKSSAKDEDKQKAIQTIAKIIVKTAQISTEMAVVGSKELIVTELTLNLKRQRIYERVKSAMAVIDANVIERIQVDINSIL